MTRYVALDTETTGLNPDAHELIEVAAIAFDCDGIQDTFQTLVRPVSPPSYHVQRLTGISEKDLRTAPIFAAVASELADFVGDSPVIGQSVDFDINFLARNGVPLPGPIYDTWDLGQLLLPGLSDYSLRGIAEHLQIDFPLRHRAYADAEASRAVFLEFRARLTELPVWMLHELERLMNGADWSLAGLVREVLSELPQDDFRAGLTADLLSPPQEIGKPLNGGRDAHVGNGEVVSLLRGAGRLDDVFPEFERREEQETMATAVNQALSDSRHLIVEAGTGTGKSLAYLLPAALHALRRGERVVISTDTLGLQEQLIEKDLPVVQRLVAGLSDEPLKVAALKGRRNYLCLKRWTAARHTAVATKEEARLHARLLVWLRQTQTGDRGELNLHSSFDAAWGKLGAENVPCLQTACSFVKNGTCFLMRAKKRAEAAHLLVVNHALLLSDIATGGHVLPPYTRLIIDEAHNLEDEATQRFAFKATAADFNDFLDRVGRRSGERVTGLAGALVEANRGGSELMGPAAFLAGAATSLTNVAARVRQRVPELYGLLTRALRECSPNGGDERLLITRATRVQSLWSDVQIAAQNLDAAMDDLMSLLEDITGMLGITEEGLLNQDTLVADAADLCQMGGSLQRGLAHALLDEDATLICWLERQRHTGEVGLSTAPLEVAEVLRRDLFDARESVVLTSATLSAGGSFDYLRERVGLEDSEEMLLGSPFDYPNSTLITLPTDIPDPNQPEFVAQTSELLLEALRASQGRALVLFTSYSALNGVSELIKAPLEAEGILVLAHGTDGSLRQMLSALRENPRTVLLGTSSFWEGVDVAGEALSLLVIVKLPFAVPTDPIYQARSALYDEPFDQYALPQAVLRFRQGFGRLIRSRTDRGVLLVLDRRLRGRRYGETFLKSLPRCSLKELPSRQVAAAIEAWLA